MDDQALESAPRAIAGDKFQQAKGAALAKAQAQLIEAINAANRAVIEQFRPSQVRREIDGNPNASSNAVKL